MLAPLAEWLLFAYTDNPILNISTRKIGGIRFLKIGRFCLSFCISRQYKNFCK